MEILKFCQDFNILTADDHQVFIAADTAEKKVNLYLSDTRGQFYVASLQNLIVQRMRDGTFDADVYEVGVSAANANALLFFCWQWSRMWVVRDALFPDKTKF